MRLVRVTVRLDTEDQAWLHRKAKEERVSMAQLMRRAIRHYRKESEREPSTIQQLLEKTKGLKKVGDGLAYQRRIRAEWEKW